MRVLLVAHGLPPAAAGGTEIYTESLARALAQAGHSVLVVAREADPMRPELELRREPRAGFEALLLNHTFRDARRFEDTWRHPGIARLLLPAIDRFEPEVAHVQHLTGLGTDLVAGLQRRRVPVLFTLNDYWYLCHRGQLLDRQLERCSGPLPGGCDGCLGAEAWPQLDSARRLARGLPAPLSTALAAAARRLPSAGASARRATLARAEHMRARLRAADALLAPSRTLAERHVAFGLEPARLEPTAQGIDVAPFAGLVRSPSSRIRLGFVGSLMVSKAPHLLLEALARLPGDRFEVQVFGGHLSYHGDDSYRARLAPLLDSPGVRWHGPVARAGIGAAFAAIDVLVVPSIWLENAPFVIREAFAAGVPVVAANLGGMAESVRDGGDGLLFRAGDAEDLARVLRRLDAEPELLPRLRAGIVAPRTIADDAAELGRRYHALASRVAQPAPRLSVVLLNWRTPDESALALRALAASERVPDEVLVVDNASGDGSAERLGAEPSQPRVIVAPRNLGFAGGMNLGIRAALDGGADLVLLLNSDAWLAPSALGRLEQALLCEPGAGLVGPAILARDQPQRVASLGLRFSARTGRMRQVGYGVTASEAASADRSPDALSGCALLVRREVFEQAGLLDEAYFFSFEDLDFALAARAAGWRTRLEPEARVLHRGGASLDPRSPERIYYGTRNQLRVAARRAPLPAPAALARALAILGWNLAHVLLTARVARRLGLRALALGARDHARGRYGPAPPGL